MAFCLAFSANAQSSYGAGTIIEPRRLDDADKQRQEQDKPRRNWLFTPRLTLAGTYSDNIDLAASGLKSSDFVSEVIPGLSAELDGNRIKGSIDYRMQNLFYADNSDFNDTFHQYNALGSAELFLKRFFVDIDSTLTQRIISSQQRFVGSNLNLTDNRTDQLTASIRPYWRQDIGTFAEALAQYRYGIVDFQDDKVVGITSDSALNDLLVSVNSPTRDSYRLLNWALKYSLQDINYESNDFDDLNFERTQAEIDYPITSTIGLIAVGGYEDNDLGAAFPSTDTRGALWEAGFRWQPNLKSQFEARYGDRFFGNTWLLRWQQRGRRINTELRYTRDLGGYTGFILQGGRLSGATRRFPLTPLGLTSQAYIRDRLDAIATLTTARSVIQVILFNEERDFRTVGNKEKWTGIIPSWEWRIAPRTALTTRLLWGRRKPSGVERDDYPLFINITLQRQIGPQTFANLAYNYTRVDSDDNFFEYQENSVTIGLTKSF